MIIGQVVTQTNESCLTLFPSLSLSLSLSSQFLPHLFSNSSSLQLLSSLTISQSSTPFLALSSSLALSFSYSLILLLSHSLTLSYSYSLILLLSHSLILSLYYSLALILYYTLNIFSQKQWKHTSLSTSSIISVRLGQVKDSPHTDRHFKLGQSCLKRQVGFWSSVEELSDRIHSTSFSS